MLGVIKQILAYTRMPVSHIAVNKAASLNVLKEKKEVVHIFI